MSTIKIKINNRGQITIPYVLRLALWCQPGDELELDMVKVGTLQVRNLTRHGPWDYHDPPIMAHAPTGNAYETGA